MSRTWRELPGVVRSRSPGLASRSSMNGVRVVWCVGVRSRHEHARDIPR